MLKKIALLFYTLIHLKPFQLAFFVYRRGLAARTVSNVSKASINQSASIDTCLPSTEMYADHNCFFFLNIEKNYALKIDWTACGLPRLWGYNLHYFDYLRQLDVAACDKHRIIASWINDNPQGAQPGWEPFTTSLRIVNWIVFFSTTQFETDNTCVNSLYQQTLWLEKNDERHILANHYFENLKALLFAGIFFEGDDAKRWRERAIKMLRVQLVEQNLPDGGHFERSPQYHCLMLENYLDLVNLVKNNKVFFDDDFYMLIKDKTVRSLDHINRIVFPDKTIPLFNDAAFDIAPSIEKLNCYANALLNYASPKTGSVAIIDEPDTGLYGIRSDDNMLLMDCGDVGPSYQPGHTHCDFLSYELMLNGQRVVVDTGVSEYQAGERRHYLRSTAAHNTISINNDEQSEIWGAFRVARRAKKRSAKVTRNDNVYEISGSYDGFYAGAWLNRPKFRHNRQINVKLVKDGFESVEVVDTIESIRDRDKNHTHTASSFIHLHPDVSVTQMGEGGLSLNLNCGADSRKLGIIEFDKSLSVVINTSIYCPQFGLTLEATCIEFKYSGRLPVTLGYCFRFDVRK